MSSDDEVPSPQPDESRILIRDRARVIPREVSEGLLLVALLRPNLGSLPLRRAPSGFPPLEALAQAREARAEF